MLISNHHNRRVQAIIKQFGQVDKDIRFTDSFGYSFAFNPSHMGFARNRLIFKFLSGFPVDKQGDPISFMDIQTKELVECEERFLSLLSDNSINLPIVNEEWDRLIQEYNR